MATTVEQNKNRLKIEKRLKTGPPLCFLGVCEWHNIMWLADEVHPGTHSDELSAC